jgi:hypothetical protein
VPAARFWVRQPIPVVIPSTSLVQIRREPHLVNNQTQPFLATLSETDMNRQGYRQAISGRKAHTAVKIAGLVRRSIHGEQQTKRKVGMSAVAD